MIMWNSYIDINLLLLNHLIIGIPGLRTRLFLTETDAQMQVIRSPRRGVADRLLILQKMISHNAVSVRFSRQRSTAYTMIAFLTSPSSDYMLHLLLKTLGIGVHISTYHLHIYVYIYINAQKRLYLRSHIDKQKKTRLVVLLIINIIPHRTL